MNNGFRTLNVIQLNAGPLGLRREFYTDPTADMAIDAPEFIPTGSIYRNELSPHNPFGCPRAVYRDWL